MKRYALWLESGGYLAARWPGITRKSDDALLFDFVGVKLAQARFPGSALVETVELVDGLRVIRKDWQVWHEWVEATLALAKTWNLLSQDGLNYRECQGSIAIAVRLWQLSPEDRRALSVDGVARYVEAWQKLEHLREKLDAESLSYDDLFELQSLAPFIAANDVQLLEEACLSLRR